MFMRGCYINVDGPSSADGDEPEIGARLYDPPSDWPRMCETHFAIFESGDKLLLIAAGLMYPTKIGKWSLRPGGCDIPYFRVRELFNESCGEDSLCEKTIPCQKYFFHSNAFLIS
jgi:hypothetical protein